MTAGEQGGAGGERAAAPTAVSLADEEAVREIIASSVMGLWDVVNNLTRLRPTSRDRFRVAIFGSARAKPGTWVYDEVKRAAAALTEMGCEVVTGGGPGLMQAANEGAASVGQENRSLGIRVDLPFEQTVNPFVAQAYEHRTFFSRLQHFVIASDAFVVVPGGIGTALEALMIWQLVQVRHVQDVPLIMVGKMWRGLVEWARTSMLDPRLHLASVEDFDIPVCVDGGDEVVEEVRRAREAWLARRAAGA